MSLKDRIANANTKEQVEDLLKEGETYKYASGATRRAWLRARPFHTRLFVVGARGVTVE